MKTVQKSSIGLSGAGESRGGGASKVGGANKRFEYEDEDREEDDDGDEDKEPLVIQWADGALGSLRQRLLLVLHLEPDWLPDPP